MTPEMLREIPLFATLNREELNDLLRRLQTEKYKANTVILWMDEPGDKFYVIEKGAVRISYTDADGKEKSLGEQGEGTFFGELSLLDGGPHTATVRALRDTTVLTINRATFYSYLDTHPQFSRTLLAIIVDRLRTNTVKLREHMTGNSITPGQPASFRRFVDRAASFVSSSRFLLYAFIFMASWIGFHTWFYERSHRSGVNFTDNPPTFFILGFILTFSSFLFTILVLTSQRGIAEQDRVQAEIEYQVNLKAQAEVMRLHLKMDDVLKQLEEAKKRND